MIEGPDPTQIPAQAGEPFAPFAAWFAEAVAAEPRDPNAMALATVDETGLPNSRIVLMKGFDHDGFVFYTNFTSTKGRELLAHPVAALNFLWKSLARQVRIRGPVESVSEAEADAYFATRPRLSQIGAWASAQSAPIESRALLEAAVSEVERRFVEEPVPRPPHWSGFRLRPVAIEFWQEAPYRLHDRFLFRRADVHAAAWTKVRLSP